MFAVVCCKHINSVGKPINLFMSVLSGLCDLRVRESYSAFSKLMASKLELICIHKKKRYGGGRCRRDRKRQSSAKKQSAVDEREHSVMQTVAVCVNVGLVY